MITEIATVSQKAAAGHLPLTMPRPCHVTNQFQEVRLWITHIWLTSRKFLLYVVMAVFNGLNLCLGVFILGGFIVTLNALKCFQCLSSEDPICADLKQNDTNSSYIKECPAEIYGNIPILCRKTVHRIVRKEGDDRTIVSRGCGFEVNKEKESNCYTANNGFKYEKSCQCFTDACNAASLPVTGVTVISTLASVAICLAIF